MYCAHSKHKITTERLAFFALEKSLGCYKNCELNRFHTENQGNISSSDGKLNESATFWWLINRENSNDITLTVTPFDDNLKD